MTAQYQRVARLTATNQIGQGLNFAGLRTEFMVEKTSESNANTAKIKIYNLSASSRTFMEEKELDFSLEVGYAGIPISGQEVFGDVPSVVEQLFTGQVTANGSSKTKSYRAGSEWVTEIEAGDGERQLNNATAEFSFGENTPFQAVMNQALTVLGLSKGAQIPITDERTISNFTASGKVKDIMDRLAKRFNFLWSVQNGAVQITKPGFSTPEQVILLTPTTGLVSNVMKREEGVEFKALINPRILPGRAISLLDTADVSGLFKVSKATFTGDTHGDEWTVEVEAVPLLGS